MSPLEDHGDARLRALAEMGLGPLWVPRARATVAAQPDAGSTRGMQDAVALAGEAVAEVADAADFAGPVTDTAPDAPLASQPADAQDHRSAAEPVLRAPPATRDAGRDRAIRAMNPAALATAIRGCTACGLCATRRNAVPGVGRSRVPWMLVGDSPGTEDDAEGLPFTGLPGRLLGNMLAEAGLDRDREVYLTNVVKCAGGGAHSGHDAVAACRPYLLREIALVQPRLIVAMGALAAHALLGGEAPVGVLRGKVYMREFANGAPAEAGGAVAEGADGTEGTEGTEGTDRTTREVPIIVTWHPAYVLKKPSEKAGSWADLCLARQTLA